MKIGMIGIGDIAKKAYLPVLTQTKGIELHVCSRNEETLKSIADTYHLRNTYHNIEIFLASGIQAAFVHSSTESHETIINQLLDHGIHVYVDKPITYDADSATHLIEKAKSKKLILMTGFNRRFAPPYVHLKHIDEPNMIIMQKNRGHQAGEIRTFIFDDFIHVIDTLLFLFPYQIEDIRIRGKKKEGKLHHVVMQLESEHGTAIGIMNREAGTTEETVEVMSANETCTVRNVSEISSHINKNITVLGSDDWEPTLKKRGFHQVTSTFLQAVRTNDFSAIDMERDLRSHLLAEQIVQKLCKQ